jgi:hypothetical protein
MMLRRSPFRWLVLAGILLFLTGLLLDHYYGQREIIHLVLGMPGHSLQDGIQQEGKKDFQEESELSIQLDSFKVKSYKQGYELQVREIDQEFSQTIHTNIIIPSHLQESFPLSPMKIRKIEDTEYRFRLKQFYPDFSFQYSYPENKDTIPPRAPGITLNLRTARKEEVFTLRSDKPSLHKLDDVVGLGCSFEFFWTFSQDSLVQINPDPAKKENKIVFAGLNNKVYFLFDDHIDSASIALNLFYPIPGTDSSGFTILQSFPDASLLNAIPVSKSEEMINPVAEVEVWKLGGRSQYLYLYPNIAGKHGGDWKVPGTNSILSCSISHEAVVNASTCKISLSDSTQRFRVSKVLNGHQVISYAGKNFRLSECDPEGIWANVSVWTAPGLYFRIAGILFELMAFLIFFMMLSRRSRVIHNPGREQMRKINSPSDLNHPQIELREGNL